MNRHDYIYAGICQKEAPMATTSDDFKNVQEFISRMLAVLKSYLHVVKLIGDHIIKTNLENLLKKKKGIRGRNRGEDERDNGDIKLYQEEVKIAHFNIHTNHSKNKMFDETK
ncbi:hypothetical protein PFDG_05268 [Plasmodium falciparum Dd2]|uniref:Uncharacterized protein n=1 Tax=Plasmodium falciparum (isolate Dd2) TaxID=57267 RepID=A0A0L7MA67_PLAF4|nr:hypothetical protein PFDG_05268 [Plasmodium falciparum Dd2]